MVEKLPTFTVDLEDYHHALHIPSNGHSSISSVYWLQYKLSQYKIKAVIYVLGKFSEEVPGMVTTFKHDGHIIKSHGENHYRGEEADRTPYSWLGFTGGFWFRLFPYWFIKWQVKKNGFFYIHPHDLDEEHPQLGNPWFNFKRHIGLKTSRKKMERLLTETKFGDPS